MIKNEHEYTLMKNPHTGENAHIDKGIVELIALLWEKHYWTVASCENERDSISITFGSLIDLQNFVISIMLVYKQHWPLKLSPTYWGMPPKHFYTVITTLKFPKEMYSKVLEHFKKHGLDAKDYFPKRFPGLEEKE